MRNLLRKRKAILKKIGQCSAFVRGSINDVCATCNRGRCTCRKKSSRRAYRLTYKGSQQKTRIVYVPRKHLPRIQQMIVNYARLRKLIEKLVETNIEMFKEEARR